MTLLFCVGANSRWYGGGFKAAPLAVPDDGVLDFIVVEKKNGRLKLLTLLPNTKKACISAGISRTSAAAER